MEMTDTTDAALDALMKRLQNPPFGTETSERNLMSQSADAITALRAERDALKAAKWDVQHTDTMNDMVQMGLARDAALAERDAAYARGVHDAADLLDSMRRDPQYAGEGCDPIIDAIRTLAALLPQAEGGDA